MPLKHNRPVLNLLSDDVTAKHRKGNETSTLQNFNKAKLPACELK